MGAVYTQLSISERRKMERWRHPKVPVDEMVRVLGWSKSTIHREINVISGPLTLSRRNTRGISAILCQLHTQRHRPPRANRSAVQLSLIRVKRGANGEGRRQTPLFTPPIQDGDISPTRHGNRRARDGICGPWSRS